MSVTAGDGHGGSAHSVTAGSRKEATGRLSWRGFRSEMSGRVILLHWGTMEDACSAPSSSSFAQDVL